MPDLTQASEYLDAATRQLALLKSIFNRRFNDHDGVIEHHITEIDTLLLFARTELQKQAGNNPVTLTKGRIKPK